MNRPHAEHAVVAMIFTLLGYFLCNVEIGAAFVIGVFGGRELDLLFPVALAGFVAIAVELIGGN